MKKFVGIFIFVAGLLPGLLAQQPAYHETLGIYKEGTELFDKAKYAAASEKFHHFIQRNQQGSYRHEGNDLVAEARFYEALCAFNLLHSNTISLFDAYLQDFPVHARANEALFYIGKMHYMRKEYKEAVPVLEKVESGTLNAQQLIEARFMLGYGYYKEGRNRDAQNKFRQIRHAEGIWGEMGAYFFAVLAYENGEYAEAYEAFGRVKPDAKYAKDVDELKASCLLKLGRYEELDELGAKLLERGSSASSQTYFILANAAYDRAKYKDAVQYFEEYEKRKGSFDRMADYRYGYSYYRQGNFGKAQGRLEKASLGDDELSQNSFYYIGHTFLKLDKLENARTAFKKAASYKFNPDIQSEALNQYAKLSFETHYFDDALAAFQKFLADYPSSPYADEAKSMIGEILLYSSNYKEAIDYLEENDGLRSNRSRSAYQRACYLYANTMYEKHRYDAAADYYKKAYNQNQDSKITSLAYYWYAESLFRQQAYSESGSAFKAFLNQPYASKHELYPMAWYGMAWCALGQSKFEDAGKNFEKFIGLADRDKNRDEYIDALLRAGDCEFALKSFDGALRYYQQVRDFRGPFADYAILQTGLIYVRKEDYQRAAETLAQLAMTYQKSVHREIALITAAQTYLTWVNDWSNASKYANMLIKDHPDSKYVPRAVIVMAIAEGRSNNQQKAVYWFKLAATEHCYDESARTSALSNLANLLPASEYDQVEAQSRSKCPMQRSGPENEKAEELAISIADQRFFDDNFSSAAERYGQYIKDFPQGKYIFQAYYYQGQCQEKLGQKDKALSSYEYIYRDSKANDFTVKALKAAADIHFANGNKLAAMELYEAMNDKSTRVEDRLAAQFGKAEVELANKDYNAAKAILTGIYTDPNTTDYSRTKANVKIGVCDYHLNSKPNAETIFRSIAENNTNVFGAESQYYIAQIEYDNGQYEASTASALVFNEKFKGYNYWKAKAFLVLAEDYLAVGDTFQAMNGTLESIVAELQKENLYPEILSQAKRRLDEIKAIVGDRAYRRAEPEDEETGTPEIDNGIKEEDK